MFFINSVKVRSQQQFYSRQLYEVDAVPVHFQTASFTLPQLLLKYQSANLFFCNIFVCLQNFFTVYVQLYYSILFKSK